jgi:antitoxin (DNA-binding transcriptional repressor) of toxin-antitoxin stability system
MQIVTIHKAERHLSRLIEKAAREEAFVIAQAGKPLVKVRALNTPAAGESRRLGFLAGHISVPADFGQMGSTEIEQQFKGEA